MKTYVCNIFEGEFNSRRTVTSVTEDNFQTAISQWFLGTGSLGLWSFKDGRTATSVVGMIDENGSVKGCWEISETYAAHGDCCGCGCSSCDWKCSCCCEVCDKCGECACCCDCES